MLKAILIKYVLPYVLNEVIELIIAELKKLMVKTDSDIDDNIVRAVEKEKTKIKDMILENVKQ